MFPLLLACTELRSDAHAYADALRAVQADPTAFHACDSVRSAGLRADCLTAAAELMAVDDAVAADTICVGLPFPLARDECLFQVAENSGDAARCAAAGQFADRCRSHLWRGVIEARFPAGSDPAAIAEEAEAAMVAADIPVSSGPFWAQLWRRVLDAPGPVRRDRCAGVPRPVAQRACEATAVAIYGERLDRRVLSGGLTCDSLPEDARPGDDPELNRILDARRRTVGCGDGEAGTAPPPN